jgi:Protein of unknown function (DUF2608)
MIQTISSFQEINWDILPPKTLVIFDIDETLITPADTLLKPIGGSFKGWEKIGPENPEQFTNYLSIMLSSTHYILVDNETPIAIQKLFQKSLFAMGLTACSTGPVGVIPSMEKWRIDQLKAVGIDFSPFFDEEFIFSELVDAASRPPLFKNGILFTGDYQTVYQSTKGQLFDIFLDQIHLEPGQIVFIDDDKKHLEAMLEAMNRREIPLQTYLIAKPPPQLDEKVAQFQLQTLLDTNRWVSDKDAKKFLESFRA